MIAFGCATTDEDEYRTHAQPGIARAAEPNSLVMRRHGYDCIHDPYNEMLDEAAAHDDLEALVLLHQDLSIDDDAFVAHVRGLLAASSEIAIAGTVGGRGAPGLAWWEGESHGYVEAPELVPGGVRLQYSHGAHEVDSVDGMLLVLSPWAVRELRFDRGLAGALDGYDLDICLQARERGKRVVAYGFGVSHHVRYETFYERGRWVRADVAVRRKWALDPDPVPRAL
jgi:hypothetical protein